MKTYTPKPYTPKQYTLKQIAEHIGGELIGEPAYEITQMGPLESAQSHQLSFLTNSKFKDKLANSKAGALILSQTDASLFDGNTIIHSNPHVGFALASQLMDNTPLQVREISPLASIHPSVKVGKNVAIGPHATICENVILGDNVTIGANCFVGVGTRLGQGCHLRAAVTLYHGVSLEDDVSIHSGTVVGSDGFGYANAQGTWIKIPQTGGVRIGAGTEIGANCAIDRGALDNTLIGKNCIIDNMVHIAHNCVIGDHTCICGKVGMAGSVNIGKYVVIAGGCMLNGHIDICDKVQITGFTMVTKSITQPGVYSSGMPAAPSREWQKNTVKLRSIDKLYERVKSLEQAVDSTTEKASSNTSANTDKS